MSEVATKEATTYAVHISGLTLPQAKALAHKHNKGKGSKTIEVWVSTDDKCALAWHSSDESLVDKKHALKL